MKKIALTLLVVALMLGTVLGTGVSALAVNQQNMNLQMKSTTTVSVSGTVFGFPLTGSGPITLADAEVYIGGGKLKDGITFAFQKTISDQNGEYQFVDIPLGTYLVMARKPGEYLPGFRLVILTEQNPVKHSVDLYLIHKLFGGGGSFQYQQYVATVMEMIPEGQEVMLEDPYENSFSI